MLSHFITAPLDFSKGEVREKIRKAMTVEEFNHIFEEYGIFED